MGRKKSPVNKQRAKNTADLFNDVFNSDEWHNLFDIYHFFRESEMNPKTKEMLLQATEDAIGRTFGKGGEEQGFKSELEFILKRLNGKVLSWVVGREPINVNGKEIYVGDTLSASDIKDIVQQSVMKLLESGRYDSIRLQREKTTFIYQTAMFVVLDFYRSLRRQKGAFQEAPEQAEKPRKPRHVKASVSPTKRKRTAARRSIS